MELDNCSDRKFGYRVKSPENHYFPPIYPDEVENGAQGISEKSRSLMLSEINEPDLKEKSYP
ncbi:MAG: hypothetical protein Ct9H300mP4_16070 [Gammaproteobacteria bacterium]|nr:MAG: hypothetical protein Ct9H300mP4_16070 [Gammaproteobacteria bacterium]